MIANWRDAAFLVVIGTTVSLVIVGAVYVVNATPISAKPPDAATQVTVVYFEERRSVHRFGDLDFIACEELRPYQRVCTSDAMSKITTLVICERGIMRLPNGWLAGHKMVVSRDGKRPRLPWQIAKELSH